MVERKINANLLETYKQLINKAASAIGVLLVAVLLTVMASAKSGWRIWMSKRVTSTEMYGVGKNGRSSMI